MGEASYSTTRLDGENSRQQHHGAALLPRSWGRSNTRLPISKLGECPSAEAQQLKVMHGICKENHAKQNRAAENHHAPKKLNLTLRQRAASLPCTGHAAAAQTLLVPWGRKEENRSK